MSEPANISQFKQQLAVLMVKMFDAWPNPITITLDDMTEAGMKWIEREGLIRAEEHGSLDNFFLHDATLPQHTLSLLQKRDQNVGMPLGQYVTQVFAEASEFNRQKAVDLLASRLLDI